MDDRFGLTSVGGGFSWVDPGDCFFFPGCEFVGSWQSNLVPEFVPEPMSASLLLSGLLGLALARRFLSGHKTTR
jgi:hypothetical protein